MGGKGHVFAIRAPHLELGQFTSPPCSAGAFFVKIRSQAMNDKPQLFGFHCLKTLFRAVGVHFCPSGFVFGSGRFGAGADVFFQGILLLGECRQLTVQRLEGLCMSFALLFRRHHAATMGDTLKSGADAVVILCGNGIKLVIVAACAVDGEAKESAAGGRDHVIQSGGTDVLLRDDILIADIIIGPCDEEGAADADLRIVWRDDIARKVLDDELVERFVVVDGLDDVVAERPKVINDEVALEAIAPAKRQSCGLPWLAFPTRPERPDQHLAPHLALPSGS